MEVVTNRVVTMEVELFLHGTPKGYNFIGKTDEFSYCSTFYTNQNEDEKIVVELRNIGNITFCYYTYIKSKNINSADSRPGGYVALTVRLDNYCRDTIAIFFILKSIYKKHVVGNFVQEVGDNTKYIVESLSSKEGELDNMMRTLVQLLSMQIPSDEFTKIKYEIIPGQKGSIQLSLLDCADDSVLNAIKKYGKVSVSMSYPTVHEEELQEKFKREREGLRGKLYHLKETLDVLSKKYEDAQNKTVFLKSQNDKLTVCIADLESSIKKLSKQADLRNEIAQISVPLLRINDLLQRYGISPSSQQPLPLKKQLEETLENRLPSKKMTSLTFLFSSIAVVLLLVVMAFQFVLLFKDNSLPVETITTDTIPEKLFIKEKEMLSEPAVTNFNNMIINIREYHGKGPLQYDKEYTLYISSKGHYNQPDSIKGLRWECDGGEIYHNGENIARLRLKKKNGPIIITCHLPNGESIVRSLEVSSNENTKVPYTDPIPKMKKDDKSIPSSKKQSQASYRLKG